MSGAPAELVGLVHRRLLDEPSSDLGAAAERHVRALAPLLPRDERSRVVGAALAQAQGLGPLEPLLADRSVTEILVNAGTEVWVERAGRLERREPLAEGVATLLIERIVSPLGLRIDRVSPMVDARLPDGSRFHAVIPPVAVDGPCLAIRRFAAGGIPLTAFAAPAVVRLLASLVERRANVVVSGATSSGKTTLLNALLGEVPAGERIVTIEDAAELRLATAHVVRLEARRGVDRGSRRGPDPCARAGRAASATGPPRGGRGPWRGSARHGDGAQHRPRRLVHHVPRQRPGGRAFAHRSDGADGRAGLAASDRPRPCAALD